MSLMGIILSVTEKMDVWLMVLSILQNAYTVLHLWLAMSEAIYKKSLSLTAFPTPSLI